MAAEDNDIIPVSGSEPGDSSTKPAFIESVTRRLDPGPGQRNGYAIDREEDDGVGLLEYWRLMRRRQGTLILSVFLGLLAAVLVTLPQMPVYQAKTSLELLNVNENFMDMKNVEQVGDEVGYNLLSDIQTQIKILQSDMLVDRVLGEMKVASPDQLADSRMTAWRKFFKLPMPAPPNGDDKALQRLKGELKVQSVAQTRIIEVKADSTSPKIAAEFANRLVQDYIEENVQSRWEMTQKTGDFLTKQMDNMRATLERSEDLMQAYARQNDLVFTDEKSNVSDARLKDLQDELIKAQANRVEKQSMWEMASAAAPETLPDVLNDPTLRLYQEKLADLRRETADLEQAFTPDYPKVRRLSAQIDAVEHSLALQRDNILKQIKNQYGSAMRREILVQTDYRKQASVVSDQSQKAIQYNIIKREVDTNRQLYESMLQHVKEASVAGALRASNIRIIDPAKVPQSPYKPDLWLNALLGLLGGAFLGVAYIAMTEKADRMLQNPSDISFYLGVPELGVIPAERPSKPSRVNFLPTTHSHRNTNEADPNGPTLSRGLPPRIELETWQAKQGLIAESFRAALTSILFTGQNGTRPRVLVVTSPGVGDGKTTVVTNLAIALAETGQRVLLVDADMRKPRIHSIFGLDNHNGLSSLLQNGFQGQQSAQDQNAETLCQPTEVPGLSVLTSGPSASGPTNLLYAKHFPGCLRKYAESFDMVLLDTPPMMTIPDARLIGKMASAVLLVVRAKKTTRDAALTARMRLKEDGIKILGTILNDWNPKHSRGGYYGYYDSYHRYYKTSSS
jgi:succinoglycan biosynthesis transport protein ExoP